MKTSPEEYLLTLFQLAVKTCHPENILKPYLPQDRTGPVSVICAGKAAASMAKAFEKEWEGTINGIAVVPFGHTEKCQYIEVIEASHPEPDQHSLIAGMRVIEFATSLTPQDTVYIMLSGGGSSLLCLPPGGISLTDKTGISKALLASGAPINEINTVRKHLSLIKGGRLLKACAPATVHSLVISDVVGNDPSVISSGPTVGDQSTSIDAQLILKKYNIEIPLSIHTWLESENSETIKPSDPIFAKSSYHIIASSIDMLDNIEQKIISDGYDCINLGELQGDAKELGIKHAKMIQSKEVSTPTIIVSGGETTVTVTGNGKGGRNAEYLLSLAIALKGKARVYCLAGDTDGIDGTMDNAGATINPDTLHRLKAIGVEPTALLENNDSYTAFKLLDDLIMTGPTRTNVNDFRAILILPQ